MKQIGLPNFGLGHTLTNSPNLMPEVAPINHVFVDYESVHEVDLSLIGNKVVSLTLLLGAKQKVDGAVVEKLMGHAAATHVVRLSSSGKNALDFVLAYYVGRVAITDPTGFVHILSKDTGFDPLIEHLRSRGIKARRHADSSTLIFAVSPKVPVIAPSPPTTIAKVDVPDTIKPKSLSLAKTVVKATATPKPKPPTDLRTRFLAFAKKNQNNLPKSRAALVRHLDTLAGKESKAGDATKLIASLAKEGFLCIDDKDAITYKL